MKTFHSELLLLEKFKDNEEIEDIKISRAERIYLVKRNILFIDPEET
ncbi:MAG: hypothetical protein GW910_05640 [Candidatus Altiarchaeum hamiconexum]|uniref:Uncharacterized ATP-binding protein MJ1010-like C-terminal domain-containing protein n=1 Tax=Candidatus Altarchaeum hamiconexum TaxID=1803513 RepID=A0A8J8CI89_9ARCH|nr:hypothetical protein [Candidatus Altarchaeum hamiconexum]NCT00811.1 hypothetical protein [Candidatus Altarchaeum hamiconexum]